MNKETGRKYESTFIPCGDALEKMTFFVDDAPEKAEADERIHETEGSVLKDRD